ncbi:MAG: glycosyltransferase [Bacteroidales bacterium]|nr:glycosyltransferase [Bacteroidales bacterium]
MLFFGFIRDYKGLDLLLKAMKAISRKFPEVRLVVAGEFYAKADYYLDLIKTLEIEEVVILKTEFIPREAVADYFCAADLVVQPYKSATQSGVTQIAYHFEKPMVVTNVGGLGELVPDGKTGLVTDTEPEAIATCRDKIF